MYVINFNIKRPPSGPQKPLTFNELGAFLMSVAKSVANGFFLPYFLMIFSYYQLYE